MSRYNKNSMVALPLVFVSALLIGFAATTQAINKEAKKTNVGNNRTFLDPFSLDVKSTTKRWKKVMHYGDIILPNKARLRSPFVPGKPE